MCHVAECQQPQHQDQDSSYSDFLATHPSIFSDATDSLEVGSWLCTTESKFSLLHCREYQKTMYAVQQLRGLVGAWWASYTAVLLLITTPHGVSSTPTSALITYLWVCSTASSKSSWTSSKETTPSLTTPSSSIWVIPQCHGREESQHLPQWAYHPTIRLPGPIPQLVPQ
jgi:hypothetical protein